MTRKELRKRLDQLAEPGYRDFISGLTPGCGECLGVRLPALRRLAKEIVRGDFKAYLDADREGECFEETMVRGIVIATAGIDEAARVKLTRSFVPSIDNWAVCDTFCASLKSTGADRGRTWKLILPYLRSRQEFKVRFATVMMLSYMLTDDYIDRVLEALGGIRHEGYYAKMAVAWAISMAFVTHRDKTLAFMRTAQTDRFTMSKAISKICDSYRVSPTDKAIVRKLAGR